MSDLPILDDAEIRAAADLWDILTEREVHAMNLLLRLDHELTSDQEYRSRADAEAIDPEGIEALRLRGIVDVTSWGNVEITQKGSCLAAYWWAGRGVDWQGLLRRSHLAVDTPTKPEYGVAAT